MTSLHLADLENSLVPTCEQQHEHTVQRLLGEQCLQSPTRTFATPSTHTRALLSLLQFPQRGGVRPGSGREHAWLGHTCMQAALPLLISAPRADRHLSLRHTP